MKHKKRTLGDWVFDIFNYLLMIVIAFTTLYPFLHVLFSSFSDSTKLVEHTGLMLRPAGFSLAGYKAVFQNADIYIGYGNTIFYVVVGTVLSTFLTALFAYPLSHKRLKYGSFLNKMVVVTMFFSAGMIPLYIIVRNLHLLNTRWSTILPSAIAAYNVLIMKTAYMGVPDSLEESARLDGANEFQSFIRIILPNVKANIAVMVLFYGVAIWNSWFSALLYITDRNKYPLQLFLREILISSSSKEMGNYAVTSETAFLEEVIKHATTVVATVPILMIYPFIQKYFIKGAMIGAVKE